MSCGSNRNPSLSEAIQRVNHKGQFSAGCRNEQFRKRSDKISVFNHPRQQWLIPVTEEKLLRPLDASL